LVKFFKEPFQAFMKAKIKKLPKSEIEVEIEISPEEFDKFIEKATFELGKNLEVEGFRKEKIPKEIIEKEIGQERILKEAAEKAIKESYTKVIAENKIEVLGQPEIEILKAVQGNSFLFRIKTAVLPEIQLPDYKKIASEVKKKEIYVQEKEVEETLKWLQKSRAKFSQILRPCQTGDFVEIEYSCSLIENGKIQKDGFILGQGHLIEGFEENLIGMRQGEEKEFSLEFPPRHFQNNLAGKTANFRTKMVSVKLVELPEINDQFAQSLGNFENLDSLKFSIREGIKLEKEFGESQRIRQEILEKIAQEIFWEIPKILINEEEKRMMENFKNTVKEKLGISFSEYLSKIGKTEDNLTNSFFLEAEKKIKNALILREISKKEGILASKEEVKEKINELLKNYPDVKKAKEIDLEKLKSYYEEVIKSEKTLQFLESFSKIAF